ncbi:hypothetical protein KP806_24880 [Paenibacillus sp. N4]|uniref:hypothetical protein n=1 Tax=Paenibacillus vietnamensis TaxID=2590547 RepID=UPI001CD05B17|nr:hypothetical protein [Paenibacillus vietnamensis]MCA0758293.1 hypothetical protein [Paenibacillus vietnamensis]
MQKQSFEYKGNWRSKTILALLGCMLAITAVGCGNGENRQNRVQTYGHDGYMGYSNSNPNLPGRHMSLTYEADGNMVEQVLAPIAGIEDTQVIFNGAAMHVNLRVNENLTDAQVRTLRNKAQAVVQYNMPRYIVHVETHK